MKISVLAIGSEILDGRVLDTNSQFISTHLTNLGIGLHRTIVCDDIEEEIVSCLDFLAKDSTYIIVTGGLGPTSDDLTREAIATYTKCPLQFQKDSLDRLKKRFVERGRPFDPANEKQAFFPSSSKIIPNPVGTAEGFILSTGQLTIASFPGVPKEMHPMFTDHLLPLIKAAHDGSAPIARRSFRVFGVPEATIGRKIHSLNLPDTVVISYRATFPEIHIVLKSTDKSAVDAAWQASMESIGHDFIFTTDTVRNLPEEVLEELKKNNKTIAVAESCTGGMVGMHLTSIPGSSVAVVGGFITYSNQLKIDLLGVSAETLSRYGAVSSETACEMARGCLSKSGANFALSITGVAGPDGGNEEKPVGTFYIGLATESGVKAYKHFFPSDRASIRKYATYVALDTLRRSLRGISPYDYAQQKNFDIDRC